MSGFRKSASRRSVEKELIRRPDTKANHLGSAAWPNVMVYPEGIYCGVQETDIPELIEEHFKKAGWLRLLYRSLKPACVVDFEEIPFFKKQTRIVLENCGIIDPESINEYIARTLLCVS